MSYHSPLTCFGIEISGLYCMSLRSAAMQRYLDALAGENPAEPARQAKKTGSAISQTSFMNGPRSG
jgi:hypothetical protein